MSKFIYFRSATKQIILFVCTFSAWKYGPDSESFLFCLLAIKNILFFQNYPYPPWILNGRPLIGFLYVKLNLYFEVTWPSTSTWPWNVTLPIISEKTRERKQEYFFYPCSVTVKSEIWTWGNTILKVTWPQKYYFRNHNK